MESGMKQMDRPVTIADWLKSLWRYKVSYLFVLPSVVLFAVFMVVPLVRSFSYSLYDWDGITSPQFTGWENFEQLFRDEYFWNALKNNIIFTVLTTVFTCLFGFLFAVAIDRRLKGWAVFKFTYFIPVMISMTVVGVLFGKILEPSFGILNSLFGKLGLESLQLAWLGDPDLALYTIIGVTVWQYSGFTMLLFLAAIEEISPEIHDAATLDGVSGFKRMTQIMLPIVKRVVFMVIMLQIIFSFKVFDIVWVMTLGGPGSASEVLGTFLYKTAFRSEQFGYASSISVVMTLIIFTISLIYLYFSNLGRHEKE
jgi:ABC-type sugar transport systems, permease components